jgi:hypothetical protein
VLKLAAPVARLDLGSGNARVETKGKAGSKILEFHVLSFLNIMIIFSFLSFSLKEDAQGTNPPCELQWFTIARGRLGRR